jgi:hypothetical protein
MLMALNAGATRAQHLVSGTITDASSARPVAGAIVRISVGEASRTTRSDERGEFRFSNVGAGRLTLTVRTLGFEPFAQDVEVAQDAPPMRVALRRLQMLDTIRIRASRQGLFGVVATAKDLKPLPGAWLRVVGVGGGRIPIDSNGHFYVPINTVGSYFLRAKADGYVPQTISVVVSPDEGVEVAFLLDTALEKPSPRVEMALADFDERMKRRGLASALVPRAELLERGAQNTTHALIFARSFAARTLRLGSTACLFVDGIPRPGLALNAIAPDEIEAIEAYGSAADRSRTLLQRWPRLAPCGDTGLPMAAPGPDLVRWVTVWLKQ